jgi:Tol biopolymer transport system component
MPADRLLPIARQLAQALAVAHAAGIVHRDIKPENVMLRPDGYVKLLDFGVARLGHGQLETPNPAIETRAGVIVGTPRYMAPEQIRGDPATAASDIFALGAVLYELATGSHPSEGRTTAAAGEDCDAAPPAPPQDVPATPSGFIELVLRMLGQRPADRPSAAQIVSGITRIVDRSAERDVRLATDTSQAASPTNASTQLGAAPASRLTWLRRASIAALTGIAAVALAVFVGRHLWQSDQSNGPDYRFQIEPPPNATFSPSAASLALSPDGRSLAFTANEPETGLGLWVHSLDSLKARRIPGADNAGQIFWSADSRSIAFGDTAMEFRLKLVDLVRGVVQPVGDVQLGGAGVGAWSRESGLIVRIDKTLHLIARRDRPAIPVTSLDSARRETGHSFPSFVTGGRHFVFLAASSETEHDGVVYLASIGSTERKALFKSDSQAVYSAEGYLLYMLGSTLLARPFDPKGLRVTGDPVVIANEVQRNPAPRRGAFTVSETGVLAYRQHNITQLVWYDRSGRQIRSFGSPGHYRNPALSPDGKTAAVAKLDYRTGVWGIWTIDLASGRSARLTSEPTQYDQPVWSSDGHHIAYKSAGPRQSDPPGMRLHRQPASGGAAELVLEAAGYGGVLHAWTNDGLVYSSTRPPNRDLDLWRLPVSGGRSPLELLATRFWDAYCQPSADGRWMAYGSNETGAFEIYGAAYPSGSGKWPLSVGGGTEPAWRHDGKELFYLSAGLQLMSVPIAAGSALRPGPPEVLFQTELTSVSNPGYTRNQYAVTADGQHFLFNEPVRKPSTSSVTVVVNWPALARKPGP